MPYASGRIGCMKKTLHIDEQLLREAKSAAGAKTDTDTVRLGLEALIRRADYERMDRAPVVPHSDVVAFVRDRKLHGRGIGWIDVHLLASALVARLELWTTDPTLATVAKELGISYE